MNPVDLAAAVRQRLHAAGLKSDIPESRIVRAARSVAAAHGRRLRSRSDQRGFPGDAEDLAWLTRPAVLDEIAERLAVHESWFFRDPKQFAALAAHVLPSISGPVSVWSVGCALGQEAWSLAMVLAENVEEWSVVASDYSAGALGAAEAGVYETRQLRGLSADRRARHLVRVGDDRWSVREDLRHHVRFVHNNVVTQGAPVASGRCDVVLCRNVLIYFHDEAIASALRTIHRAMTPEGWLVLGSAESLWGITDAFEVLALSDAFAYRKAGRGRAAPAAPAAGSPPRPGQGRRPARPAGPPPGGLPHAGDLVAEARRAAAQGRHDEAARWYRQAAYLDPDLADAHLGLAEALAHIGDRRGAARARAAARRLGS